MIVISASSATTGRSVAAKVVDECDSVKGCDSEHAGLPLCGNTVIDGSAGVWNALGLNKDLGVVDGYNLRINSSDLISEVFKENLCLIQGSYRLDLDQPGSTRLVWCLYFSRSF
ncbi:unnamed protein product [Prunus armeniaca]